MGSGRNPVPAVCSVLTTHSCLPRRLLRQEGQEEEKVRLQQGQHGYHQQKSGRERAQERAEGHRRLQGGPAGHLGGGQEAQGGEAGAEEGRDAPELPEGGGAAGSGRRGAAEEVGGGRVSAPVLLFAFTSANRKMINMHAIC